MSSIGGKQQEQHRSRMHGQQKLLAHQVFFIGRRPPFQMYHNILQRCGRGIGAKAGRVLGPQQSAEAFPLPFASQQQALGRSVPLRGCQCGYAVPDVQCVRVCVCRHLAPPQVYDVVGAFFQVGGDMRGKQDADAFVLGKLEKDLQQFVPGNGIQPAGGFVQHQKAAPGERVPEPGRTLPSCPRKALSLVCFHPARTARDTGGKPSRPSSDKSGALHPLQCAGA